MIVITHHPVLYTACVCSNIELQLGSYVHTYTNETHSPAPLQDLIPTLVANIQSNTSCSQSRD